MTNIHQFVSGVFWHVARWLQESPQFHRSRRSKPKAVVVTHLAEFHIFPNKTNPNPNSTPTSTQPQLKPTHPKVGVSFLHSRVGFGLTFPRPFARFETWIRWVETVPASGRMTCVLFRCGENVYVHPYLGKISILFVFFIWVATTNYMLIFLGSLWNFENMQSCDKEKSKKHTIWYAVFV